MKSVTHLKQHLTVLNLQYVSGCESVFGDVMVVCIGYATCWILLKRLVDRSLHLITVCWLI